MTSCPYKQFGASWLALTAAGVMGLATFNVLVDPSGAYPRWHVKAFEPLRYLKNDRVHKAEMARRGDWQVIILGSSRSNAGMQATPPYFATNQTCNLSLDGAVMPELVRAFEFARERNPIKHVILCLDLFMFSSKSPWMQDYAESRFNPRLNWFSYYCLQLLGRTSTDESWGTLRRWLRHDLPTPQSQHGFYAHDIGQNTSQRELFDRVLHVMIHYTRLNNRRATDPARLEMFREVVRVCRDRGIDLRIAIMPVHALDLELLYDDGRWPQLEKWKSDLVAVVAEEGMEGKFPLWDFNGYSGPPLEPLPAAGDTTNRMKFYFENSHCTPVVGGYMLDAMLGGKPVFGVELTRSNLDAHLARVLADRAEFARTNAADVQWVRRIVAEADP